MVAFRSGDFSLFLFGFAKNTQGSVDDRQLVVLHGIAEAWLAADAEKITTAMDQGELIAARR